MRNLVEPLINFFLTKNKRSSASILWSDSNRKWRTNKSVQYGVPWRSTKSESRTWKFVTEYELYTVNKIFAIPSLTYFLRSFLLWKLTSSNSCSRALGDRVFTESTMELNLSQLTAIMIDSKFGIKDCHQIYRRSIIGTWILVWSAFKLILMDQQERTCITNGS